MSSAVPESPPTNRVHGVRSEFEHAIEYEGSTLEKYVAPVPAVVLDDIVSFGLYPQIKPDQSHPGEPPVRESYLVGLDHGRLNYLATCIPSDRPSGTRKQANANMQYDRKSLG